MSAPSAAIGKVVALMIALGAGSAALHGWVNARTAARIAANEHAYAMRQLNEILPPSAYDNELANDFVVVRSEELLGGPAAREVYRAFAKGRPVAAVIATVAPNGYSGDIHLLVGVRTDGTLAGVRVTAHRETPGLGDRIEVSRSDWIERFAGRSLNNPEPERWAVRNDGGDFDQFTGATVTPRAVVQAVRDALLYFDAHRDEIFSATAADAP